MNIRSIKNRLQLLCHHSVTVGRTQLYALIFFRGIIHAKNPVFFYMHSHFNFLSHSSYNHVRVRKFSMASLSSAFIFPVFRNALRFRSLKITRDTGDSRIAQVVAYPSTRILNLAAPTERSSVIDTRRETCQHTKKITPLCPPSSRKSLIALNLDRQLLLSTNQGKGLVLSRTQIALSLLLAFTVGFTTAATSTFAPCVIRCALRNRITLFIRNSILKRCSSLLRITQMITLFVSRFFLWTMLFLIGAIVYDRSSEDRAAGRNISTW